MNNDINLNQTIHTARLQLIPQTSVHAQEMFKVLNDPALYVFTGGKPPASAESLATRFKQLESRTSQDESEYWLNWVIQNESSDFIGYVQATLSGYEASIAWVIGSQWQKRGYAVEASIALVQWLKENKVKVIHAYIHPDHQASQAVARKLGLRQNDQMVDGEEIWEIRA